MTDPTASQTVAAMVEKLGAFAVVIAFLRRYWKPFLGTLAIATSVGKIIQQGEQAKDDLAAIKLEQSAQAMQIRAVSERLTAQIGTVSERLTKVEGEWGALFGAAHINVVPNRLESPRPAQPAKLYAHPRRPPAPTSSASTPATERPQK